MNRLFSVNELTDRAIICERYPNDRPAGIYKIQKNKENEDSYDCYNFTENGWDFIDNFSKESALWYIRHSDIVYKFHS